MAYSFHGVELGEDNAPPSLDPSASSGASLANAVTQFVPLVTGAAQGVTTGLISSFMPKPPPPPPPKTKLEDYILPVAGVGLLVAGILAAKKRGLF